MSSEDCRSCVSCSLALEEMDAWFSRGRLICPQHVESQFRYQKPKPTEPTPSPTTVKSYIHYEKNGYLVMLLYVLKRTLHLRMKFLAGNQLSKSSIMVASVTKSLVSVKQSWHLLSLIRPSLSESGVC